MSGLLITAVDNANGTGITVTVTGSPGGSTNQVQATLSDRTTYAPYGAPITGDGAIQIPAYQDSASGAGLNFTHVWFVQVVNSSAGVSNTVAVAPTLGLPVFMFQAAVACQLALIAANIRGIGGNVYRSERPEPIWANVSFPCLMLWYDEPEGRQPKDNTKTLWTPILTVMLADRAANWQTDMELHEYIRGAAMDLFDRKRLAFPASATTDAARVTVVPKDVAASVAPGESQAFQCFASSFGLRFEVYRLIGGNG